MRFLLVSIGLIILFFSTHGQVPVSFDSEYIDFSIDSDYFTINGVYKFVNKTQESVNARILFPFAVNITDIDSIRIIDLNHQRTIPFQKRDTSMVFTWNIGGMDTSLISIYYRQPTRKTNIYILQSANTWKESLSEAKYTLKADKNLIISVLSIPADSFINTTLGPIYNWIRYNFKPRTDFIISIKYCTKLCILYSYTNRYNLL